MNRFLTLAVMAAINIFAAAPAADAQGSTTPIL
jgi:hypothetical protein